MLLSSKPWICLKTLFCLWESRSMSFALLSLIHWAKTAGIPKLKLSFPRIEEKQPFLLLFTLSFNDTGVRPPSGWGISTEGENNYVEQVAGSSASQGLRVDPPEKGHLFWPRRGACTPRAPSAAASRVVHLAFIWQPRLEGKREAEAGVQPWSPRASEGSCAPSGLRPRVRSRTEGWSSLGGCAREAANEAGVERLR